MNVKIIITLLLFCSQMNSFSQDFHRKVGFSTHFSRSFSEENEDADKRFVMSQGMVYQQNLGVKFLSLETGIFYKNRGFGYQSNIQYSYWFKGKLYSADYETNKLSVRSFTVPLTLRVTSEGFYIGAGLGVDYLLKMLYFGENLRSVDLDYQGEKIDIEWHIESGFLVPIKEYTYLNFSFHYAKTLNSKLINQSLTLGLKVLLNRN